MGKKFTSKLSSIRAKALAPPLLKLYREYVKPGPEENALLAMRGNPESTIMVIAPPFSQTDLENGLPFSDDEGLLVSAGFDSIGFTEDEFCLTSCQRHGIWKPGKVLKKEFYLQVLLFLKEACERKLITKFVCIGGVAFQYMFGRGKKPALETVIGAEMPIAEFKFCPVLVMPDSHGLIYYPHEDRKMDFYLKNRSQELKVKYNKLFPKLKEFTCH